MTHAHAVFASCLTPILAAVSSGCTAWKLDIATDDIHFRTTQDYPESLRNFHRVLRTYRALSRAFEVPEGPREPMLIEYSERSRIGEEFAAVIPEEAEPTSAPPGEGAPSAGEPLDAGFEESVARIREIALNLYAIEFPEDRYVTWLREGLITFLQHGRIRVREGELVPLDFASFAELAWAAAGPGRIEEGRVFRASEAAFGGKGAAPHAYRAALVVAHRLTHGDGSVAGTGDGIGIRRAVRDLAAMPLAELEDLEKEALRSAYSPGPPEA